MPLLQWPWFQDRHIVSVSHCCSPRLNAVSDRLNADGVRRHYTRNMFLLCILHQRRLHSINVLGFRCDHCKSFQFVSNDSDITDRVSSNCFWSEVLSGGSPDAVITSFHKHKYFTRWLSDAFWGLVKSFQHLLTPECQSNAFIIVVVVVIIISLSQNTFKPKLKLHLFG